VTPGSITVLTGPNGSGKSAALEVMLGLTPPTSGRALIGGIDAAELDPRSWWREVAWLPQRPVMVPGTVRANRELFGQLPDIETACRMTGFDEVLATLPDGLDTVIGRDGTGLSLGQRQRLALARVLGSPKPVLLLDEPTAYLDVALESRVLRTIVERARAGAAVVVVGHRQSVVAIGDRVIRLGGELLVPQ
jgi:ATP-binding cassette subfamily C protein CydD